MRPITLSIKIAAFASGLISCASLAQSSSSCGVAGQGFFLNPNSVKSNIAFSATVQTTYTQELPRGNAIHGVVVTHYYRDSTGRTRNESPSGCAMDLDGHFRPVISVVITDPATHTTTRWNADGRDKVARIIRQDEHPLSSQPSPAPPPAPPVLTPEQRTLSTLTLQYIKKNVHTEKLPDDNITGVSCEHTRMVTTIPRDDQGNDLAMESLTETCISHDTGLNLLHVIDSPTSGRTETKFTEFTRGEPDPSVFAPPPGYTVQEQPVRQVGAEAPR
jgi:hypothetical protein